MVGAEQHGHAEHGRLVDVVYAGAEASAHVGDVAVAIGCREQSEAVHHQHALAVEGALGELGLGPADGLSGEGVEQALHALGVVFVGRDYGLDLGVLAQPGEVDVLVGGPGAAGDEDGLVAGGEAFEDGHGAPGVEDVGDTVEAGVAAHAHAVHADAGKQAAAVVVLHHQACEAVQQSAVPLAAPAEEDLSGAEDAGDEEGGHAAPLQAEQVVAPELVLDEDGGHGLYLVEEALGEAGQVEGQVADGVGAGPVLPHLVARGGEEGEQDPEVGPFAPEPLHEGASLLELAERGGVHPHVFRSLLDMVVEILPHVAVSAVHEACLAGARGGEVDAAPVEAYAGVVEGRGPGPGDVVAYAHRPRVSMARRTRAATSARGMISVMSNMCGPRQAPTTHRRKAFMTLPRW